MYSGYHGNSYFKTEDNFTKINKPVDEDIISMTWLEPGDYDGLGGLVVLFSSNRIFISRPYNNWKFIGYYNLSNPKQIAMSNKTCFVLDDNGHINTCNVVNSNQLFYYFKEVTNNFIPANSIAIHKGTSDVIYAQICNYMGHNINSYYNSCIMHNYPVTGPYGTLYYEDRFKKFSKANEFPTINGIIIKPIDFEYDAEGHFIAILDDGNIISLIY